MIFGRSAASRGHPRQVRCAPACERACRTGASAFFCIPRNIRRPFGSVIGTLPVMGCRLSTTPRRLPVPDSALSWRGRLPADRSPRSDSAAPSSSSLSSNGLSCAATAAGCFGLAVDDADEEVDVDVDRPLFVRLADPGLAVGLATAAAAAAVAGINVRFEGGSCGGASSTRQEPQAFGGAQDRGMGMLL